MVGHRHVFNIVIWSADLYSKQNGQLKTANKINSANCVWKWCGFSRVQLSFISYRMCHNQSMLQTKSLRQTRREDTSGWTCHDDVIANILFYFFKYLSFQWEVFKHALLWTIDIYIVDWRGQYRNHLRSSYMYSSYAYSFMFYPQYSF